jgi:aspartate-semialdehyde dehydrogenase
MADPSVQSGITVALVGASGAVGQDLLTALDRSSLPVAHWRLIASRAARVGSLEVGGKSVKVHPAPPVFAESALFEDVDLIIFATPPEVTREQAPGLAEAGVAIIDVGAALADRGPLVVPGVDMTALARFPESRIACAPTAATVLVATALAPLFRLGAERVHGTVMLSAGVAGRDGMEELSAQVLALFNQGEPPRAIFPSGLAFDLHAQVGRDSEGWTSVERRLSAEVAAVLRIPPEHLALSVAMVPLFSGVAASLHVSVPGGITAESAAAGFEGATTVRLGDPVPGPRRLTGKATAYVGRLRPDPLGDGLSLWAAADNLRFGASGNVVAIASALYRTGML